MSLSRVEAWRLVEAHVENVNTRRHMLACEAIMRAVGERLGEDAELWALAGLVHDLDVEATADDAARHGVESASALDAAGAPETLIRAVAAHNEMTGVSAESRMEIALLAADQLSGLITAATLVRPDKSLAGVKLKSLKKRYRESAFARGVDRASISRCEELGLSLEEFMATGLAAMQEVADDLGLA